jgi:hypothetical protein
MSVCFHYNSFANFVMSIHDEPSLWWPFGWMVKYIKSCSHEVAKHKSGVYMVTQSVRMRNAHAGPLRIKRRQYTNPMSKFLTLWRRLSPFGETQLFTLPTDIQTDLKYKPFDQLLSFWWLFYRKTTPLQWSDFGSSFRTWGPVSGDAGGPIDCKVDDLCNHVGFTMTYLLR